MYKLKNIIQFNPQEKLCKGIIARKITMEQLTPFNRYVQSNTFEEYKGGSKFRNGDTIMARITPCLENGKTAYISSLNQNELAFGSTEFIVLRNIEGLSDSKYIYYLAISPQIREIAIKSMVGSSGRQRVQQSVLENYEVVLPPLDKQKEIATILSSLDDKIELNSRINRNLEQQAQALFKAWFVDFEPFKNGKFVDSELGRIPEGWKIGLLNELIELQSGFAFKSDTFVEEGEYRLITIKAVQDGYLDISGASYINEVPTKMPHYCFLQIGDMLLSLTGNVGRVCIVSYNNLLLNQRVAKIKPIKEMDRMFTYTLFRRNEFKNRLIYLAKGTAQLNLSPIETIKQKVIIPPRHILNRYGTIANIMYDSIIEKMQESIALTNLRDTLLPRLMSGELNVNTITE